MVLLETRHSVCMKPREGLVETPNRSQLTLRSLMCRAHSQMPIYAVTPRSTEASIQEKIVPRSVKIKKEAASVLGFLETKGEKGRWQK